MSGEQYFQVAAANIRNALLEKQKEIDALKLEISQQEQAFQKQKLELERDRNTKEAESGFTNIDGTTRARLLKEAMDDQKAISDAEMNFKKQRDQLMRSIDTIQRDINGLQGLTSDLNRRAGTS